MTVVRQTDLQSLTDALNAFRDARDWRQFHTPKDMAISVVLEAGELLEHFQWKSADEMSIHVRDHKSEISEEVADIFTFLLEFADDCGIDLVAATYAKLAKSEKKYPVAKARGNHTKYTELGQ